MAGRFSLFLSLLVCLVFLANGSWPNQISNSARLPASDFIPHTSAPTPLAHCSATEILDRTIQIMSDISWLEMTIWQRMESEHGCFQAHGRLCQGTEQRFRCELAIQTEKSSAKLHLVSDGKSLWQAFQHGPAEPEISRWKMVVSEGNPLQQAKESTHFLAQRGWTSPLALLRNLRQQLTNLQRETGTWQGKPVFRLGGDWDPQGSKDQPCLLIMQPRRCSIYFDVNTLWPGRVEWLGWQNPGETPRPVLQLEFRDPVVNRPLTPEACAQLFTPPP